MDLSMAPAAAAAEGAGDAAAAASGSSSKPELPGPSEVDANMSLAYATTRPDMLQDPWGCVMSTDMPDAPATSNGAAASGPAGEPDSAEGQADACVQAKAMPVPDMMAVKSD